MTYHEKYNPTKACVVCGEVKRIHAKGRCSKCYVAYRNRKTPGYLDRQREYRREFMRTYDRKSSGAEYVMDPMRAVRILTAFFEANDVNIDDLCAYIAMSRARNKRDGPEPEGRHKPRHHWNRRKFPCRQ